MASPGGLGRLETSRTAGPSGLNLLPPPSIWPHLRRATPATWHSGFTFRGSSLTTGSRAAVGRLVSGRTALTRNGSPAPDDDSGAPWSCTHSLQQQAGPGSGSARERRSVLARSSASAGASAGGQASWPSGGGAGWESSDASENGAGPRGTATAARGADNGGDGAATAVVTPGSARDLLRSTLNAIDVLQSPFKANDMYDQDKGQDDAVHIEHGLASASASVGRAVYEVLRISPQGKQRRIYVKRRDLLRSNGLLPRDLRRIDPTLSVTKTSPAISIKEHVLLVNLGGVRLIVGAEKCLLFEPSSPCSRKFLELVSPRLQASDNARISRARRARGLALTTADAEYGQDAPPTPFELEILEGALMVATGRLDAELLQVTRRVSAVLQTLPKDITPVNLEELRRVKQVLVELESKADTLRDMLEELMDDEGEIRDMNLSSRPKREERRRQRERERLEREMERDTRADGGQGSSLEWSSAGWDGSDKSHRRSHDGGEEGRAEAETALEEMEEAEAEEREAEEVEDLLEYYMQRAATTQSEAERLLAGARDLEESIGVSLSARRFEVNRLELTLSIGSFAAALGAVVAGIFGMNLRSTCEDSVIGFWGCTAGIVIGCIWVFAAIYRYMRQRRIL